MKDSNNFRAHYYLGKNYARNHKLDRAEEHLSKAVQLLPVEKDFLDALYRVQNETGKADATKTLELFNRVQ